MKIKTKANFILIISIALMVAFSSCKKDEDNLTNETISEEDAVEVVENALADESAGMTAQITSCVEFACSSDELSSAYCGLSCDSTINFTNPSGTAILFNYTFGWEWVLKCNTQQLPEELNFSYNMDGWYDAPRMLSEDAGTHNFSITGLSYESTSFVYSGTYKRSGSNQSKIGLKQSFTSTITITAYNVTINKSTGKLTGGNANIVFHAETSGGKVFDYEGTITYYADETATLTFENEFTLTL